MPNKSNILKIILTLIAFLLVHASQAQVLKFMGRYDVSRVDSINDTTFRLSGEFVDLTGSYTALDADTNDKIIIRGYNSDGKVIYDRFKITGIDARNTSNLEVFVQSDFPAGVQNMTGWPGTGSFPIASPTADTSLLTYRPSMYMNGIDPDYDAALDNLNIQYASGSIADGFWNLDGQDIENMNAGYVGIGKKPTTMLDVDGVITATGGNSTNWNTAYGWGDHSIAGYLTGTHTHLWAALLDPPSTYTPTTHTHNYVSSVGGSLPLQSSGGTTPSISFVADSLALWYQKMNKGATAYGWGNHASAGYVTGTPWTAMGYITDGNTGWDNSYGFITSLSGAILVGDSNKTSAGNYITRKFVTDNFSAIGHNHSGVYDPAGTASGLMSTHNSTYDHTHIANGQTAYGWGNHASAGYVTGTPWTAMGYITDGNTGWDNSYGFITDGNTGWDNSYGFITDGNTGWDNSYGFITSLSGAILVGDSNKTSAGNYITRKFVTDNFAALGHNHSGTYEPAISKSTGYATWNGSAWSWKNETYSLSSHNHDGSYSAIGHNHSLSGLSEKSYNSLTDKPDLTSLHSHSNATALSNVSGVNTGDQDLSGYSLTTHNHSGVYEPSMGTKSTGYATWTGSAWSWKNESYMTTSHPANGITSQNMVDWTLSGSIWYTFGILNGLIKGDGNFGYTAITDNSSNWNTAYGWGNHASQGYHTGNGASGKIAKYTGTSTLGSSIMTEYTGRVDVDGTLSISTVYKLPTTGGSAGDVMTYPASGSSPVGLTWGKPWQSEGYILDGNTGWDNSYGFIVGNDSLKLNRVTSSTWSKNDLLAQRIILNNQGDYTRLRVGLKKGAIADDSTSAHIEFFDLIGTGNDKQSFIKFNVGKHKDNPVTMLELYNSDLTNYIKMPTLARASGTADSAIWQDPTTGKIYVKKVGGISGTVTVSQGGTGVTSLDAYELLAGGTTSTGTVQTIDPGTAGQVLTSNGSGVLPSFQTPSSGGIMGYCDLLTEDTYDSIFRVSIGEDGWFGGTIFYTITVYGEGETPGQIQTYVASTNFSVLRTGNNIIQSNSEPISPVTSATEGTMSAIFRIDDHADRDIALFSFNVSTTLTPNLIVIKYKVILNDGEIDIINPNGCD